MTLHNGLANLNYRLFKNTAIREITIPASVTTVDKEVFADCKNLTSINIDPKSKLSSDTRLALTNNKNTQGGGQSAQGTKKKASEGFILDEVAWHKGNSGDKPHAVKQKKANELGLYDMCGNVATLQTGTIRNCINSGTITGGSKVGGIAGESPNPSIINGCINNGEVTGKNNVGDITAKSFGSVKNSVNIGKVTGNNNVGGIVGSEHYSSSSIGYGIENCYNLGEVTGNGYVGGITGNADIKSTINYNASVKNCYNAGLVSSTSSSKGGVIGYISVGQGTGKVYIENSYYYADKGVTVGIGGTISNDYIEGSQPTSVSESDLDTLLESLNSWVGTKTSYKKWKAGTNGYPEFE